MLSFKGGQLVRPIQLHMSASAESSPAPEVVSELDEQGTAIANDFGFAEAGVEIEAIAEPEYRISNAVTGFAPAAADYLDEIAELGFPALETFAYIVLKRAFDIVFSVVAIAIICPLMLLIAVAIKLTSPGPVLFAQNRVGRDGIFRMFKFRSMYVNDCSDTHHTFIGDPRITRVGALLRRTSLDELPQLFNVLRGEMSIVGPRPELVKFVHKFTEQIPDYMVRHLGKGGITGWAQVNGFRGSETSIPVRIEYDLEYLRNWSFWLDLKIILITIYKGLFRNAF